ncbi:alpha/beta hydrolase [Iningainema tapete]|uniref:Alpha/beta hydrolase n=1 Tax=Iningainema tapete BLCC-T55 TaxID=2748662 RepID=A0A8J7BXF6_9CYAN|nr:alpha/beta hydrolase [Iningainema tapete]MBD2773717.1 alpha/beta hydrolase [Iningainema tapete BLCC-T55]
MNCPSLRTVIARLRSYNHLLGKQSIWLQVALGILNTSLIPILTTHPASGAERVELTYGILERSIPINSLEVYAKTGKVNANLAVYPQYGSSQELTQLRQILLTRIPLNAVEVSQFLYTPIGERLLKRLGEFIQTESRLSGFYAIRAALILAAADPQGLTLLNVLRKFPSSTISINLTRSRRIVNALETLVNQTQKAIALINEQSNLEATTTPTLTALGVPSFQQPGRFTWQKLTITLNDLSRNRTFPADIYLPRTSSPRPVVVISHGLGSDRTSFAYLARHLASYGFVVAVPEHPGSNSQQLQALLAGTADRVTSSREFIDRPLDVKYLLDELTRLSRNNPAFAGRLNLQQIGVVGQSFGGYTVLALAGAPINFQQLRKNCPALEETLNISQLLQCLALRLPPSQYDLFDPRVKAVIAINPIDSSIMGQASLKQIKIPVMIVTSSADTIAPALLEQIQPFSWLTTPNKYLVLINGGTHFSTLAQSPNAAVPVPTEVIGPVPALARSYVQALSVPFFQTYVVEQPSYRRYLSADYVNSISQEPLPLSLVKSLTPTQLEQTFNAVSLK